jgi:adenosylcobinamide-GDP ribazoletransferase
MQPPPSLFRPLLLAAGTLTVVRVPVRGPVPSDDLRLATVFYPLVGLFVGALPALALLLPLPSLPRAVLALAAWVLVTGALHLDGWADCCDAAFAPPRADAEETRQRRLAILKDPRVGVFGVAGTVLLLLGKTAALAYAPPAAPLAAAPLARWAMVYVLRTYPPARAEGLAASLGRGVPLWGATLVAIVVLVATIWCTDAPWIFAVAVVAGTLAALSAADFLARRFGGITGDVCGAVGEAAELAALWVFLPWGA